jgi:hypothetical protein
MLALLGCQETTAPNTASVNNRAASTPEPVKNSEIMILFDRCKAVRTQSGDAKNAESGRLAMEVAVTACQDYLKKFSNEMDANQVKAIEVEGRYWLEYYSNVSYLESLISDNQIDQARKYLTERKDKFPQSDRERLEKLLNKKVAQNEQASMTGFSEYAKSLYRKYAKRLTFKTSYAREVVESFYLDCKSPDKRALPITNVIMAKLAAMDRQDMHLEIEADSRGEDVRVVDYLVDKDGKVVHSSVAYEINKWNEIHTINRRLDALYNACFNGYGEIWVVPSD